MGSHCHLSIPRNSRLNIVIIMIWGFAIEWAFVTIAIIQSRTKNRSVDDFFSIGGYHLKTKCIANIIYETSKTTKFLP